MGDPGDVIAAGLALQLRLAGAAIAGAGAAVAFGAPVELFLQAVLLVPLALVTVTGAVLRGRETMGSLAVAAVGASIVTIATALVGFAIDSAPIVPILALGLGATTTAVVQRRATGPLGLTASASTRRLVAESAPFAGMVILAALGAQGGLIIVELTSSTPTGGYGAAVRVLEAARLLPAAVVGAWFPRLVARPDTGPDHDRWATGLGVYAVTVGLAVIAAAPLIDRLVFDSQPDGVAALRVLALSVPLTVARLVMSSTAIAQRRERTVLWSAVAGTCVVVIGGLAVVDHHGVPGVAAAQVVGVGVSVAWLAVDRRRS